VLPRSGPGSLPPALLLTLTALSGVVLLAGLVLSYPTSGLRSVVGSGEADEGGRDGNRGEEAVAEEESADTQ